MSSRHIPEFLKTINSKSDVSKKLLNKRSVKQVEIVFESSDDSSEDESIENNESKDEYNESNPSGCRVVKIARKGGKIAVDCDVYIGRRCTMGGWDLKESKWHNPFKVDDKNPIDKVLDDFYYYIKSFETHESCNGESNLMNDLYELKGKVLGCWCKIKGNEPCHGDVLINLLNEQIRNKRKLESQNTEMFEKLELDKKNTKLVMKQLDVIVNENKLIANKKKLQDENDHKQIEKLQINKNKKRVDRHQEIVKTYGSKHDLSSVCEENDRPLTPLSESCYTNIKSKSLESLDEEDENDITIHEILSMETQSYHDPNELFEELD